MMDDFLTLNDISTGALVFVRTSTILTITEAPVGSVLTVTSGQGLRVTQAPASIFAQMRSRIPRGVCDDGRYDRPPG